MLKKITKIILTIILFVCFKGFSQSIIQSKTYAQNYFRYPLNLPPSTAGSFGELRPNHFHSGLDFKTNHRVGYPVFAVFDGYVSRLRVSLGGFGNAIYITHPNGYTSVYGHIEKFSDDMIKLIRETQYKLQSFEVDINLQPSQILVCKDDVIALSGNAGASEGPHLHFELRDALTEETINPQLFGLTIPDKIPPAIARVAIYQLDGKPFSEKTPRKYLTVVGKTGNYHLKKMETLNLSGQVGFGISTNDMNSVSENHNGVYSIELKLDGKTVYTFAVEHFAFDQTHAINAYIDYPVYIKSHNWIQKCFILPGSNVSLYPQSINRGVINFNDNAMHQLEYVVKDVAGNTSKLAIDIKANKTVKNVVENNPEGIRFKYNQQNVFSNQYINLTIPPGNLYDDVDFVYKMLPEKPGTFSAVHSLHNRFTPIHDGFELWIKPDTSIGKYKNKGVIVNSNGICDGGNYEDGFIKATAHSFGDYYVRIDTVAPVILPINIRNGINLSKASGIFVKISDNLSGIKSYTGKIDDKWVLMEWDLKSKILSYTFNSDIATGNHKFELTVSDNKDNVSIFKSNFIK